MVARRRRMGAAKLGVMASRRRWRAAPTLQTVGAAPPQVAADRRSGAATARCGRIVSAAPAALGSAARLTDSLHGDSWDDRKLDWVSRGFPVRWSRLSQPWSMCYSTGASLEISALIADHPRQRRRGRWRAPTESRLRRRVASADLFVPRSAVTDLWRAAGADAGASER